MAFEENFGTSHFFLNWQFSYTKHVTKPAQTIDIICNKIIGMSDL